MTEPAHSRLIVAIACASMAMACGRKGPPLPPLVKIPVAPANVVADRRGDTVDLQFTVPNTNTDNSKPANVTRVEVYGFTGPTTVSDADVLKHGAKVATIDVKSPRDPDATTDPDDPDASSDDVDAPEGNGLDQGVVAHVTDTLTPAARVPTSVPPPKTQPPAAVDTREGPLLGPPPVTTAVRTYIGVGVAKNGRKGPSSKRVAVPLVAPPTAPGKPEITYTETAITVTWRPSPSAALLQAPATGTVLAARPIGMAVPRLAYHVYERPPSGPETPLTETPVGDPSYRDTRMAFGTTRCYAVRAIETLDALAVESDESQPSCTTLVDTFAPKAPVGLNAVAGAGEINLIWDPNSEADLQGYIILRAPAPSGMLAAITPMPIRETSFRDAVAPGTHYIYALQAVDRAGNVSPVSARIDETAR